MHTMMHHILRQVHPLNLLFLVVCCIGCPADNKNPSESESSIEFKNKYRDGQHCASVEYSNPETRTESTYSLNVEVQDDELTMIYWPNGGWLDNSHFSPLDISNGTCAFTSDGGYKYIVTLLEFGDCDYVSDYEIRRDVINQINRTRCPKCGDRKSTVDEFCFACEKQEDERERHTCSRCGNFEFGVYGGLCSSCKRGVSDMQRVDQYSNE